MYRTFRKGLDLVTDVTGNTPKANHYFVAMWGNDSLGDGSLSNPFATHAKVATVAPASSYIVFYEGEYIVLASEMTVNYTYLADGKVTFVGDNSSITTLSASSYYYDINFENYGVQTANSRFYNCIFRNISLTPTTNKSIFTEDCEFMNCTLGTHLSSTQGRFTHRRCKFINSPLITYGGSTTSGQFIYSCDFDENSSITLNNGAGGNVFANNNYLGTLTNVQGFTLSNNKSEAPLYNNKAGGDFSVQSNSPLLSAGYEGENIGGTKVGESYFEGSEFMDSIVNASPLLSYTITGEIETTGTTDMIESEIITLGDYRYLPTLVTAGFYNVATDTILSTAADDRQVYFVKWAGKTLVNGAPNFGAWRKLLLGEEPTIDANGVTNAEDGFEPGTADYIPAYYYKEGYVFMKRS